MKSSIALSVVASCYLLFACKTRANNDASIEWAHYPTEVLVSTPLGRAEILSQRLKSNLSTIDVCVEGEVDGVSGAELLFETRLSYAAWFSASKAFDAKVWNLFRFISRRDCTSESEKFSAIVVFFQKKNQIHSQVHSFEQSRASCTEVESSKVVCESTQGKVGVGSPGTYSYSYLAAGRWTEVEFTRPAYAYFSPYVRWHSLAKDIELNRGLNASAKKAILSRYRALLSQRSPSFEDLVAFVSLLKEQRVVGAREQGLAKALPPQPWSEVPRPFSFDLELALFHILLHEVGHQFGMDHADNPASQSVKGAVGGSDVDSYSSSTSEATMAYHEHFFYLTPDDEAGVESVAKSIRAFLAKAFFR